MLVIEGFSLEEQKKQQQQGWQALSVLEHIQQYTKKGMTEKEAMKQAAKDRGVSKREIYAAAKK